MGVTFLGGGGSGQRAREDAIWLNGFLTLKCSKNTAFSLQTCDGICVNTAFCVARVIQPIVLHSLMQLVSECREGESHREATPLLSSGHSAWHPEHMRQALQLLISRRSTIKLCHLTQALPVAS